MKLPNIDKCEKKDINKDKWCFKTKSEWLYQQNPSRRKMVKRFAQYEQWAFKLSLKFQYR